MWLAVIQHDKAVRDAVVIRADHQLVHVRSQAVAQPDIRDLGKEIAILQFTGDNIY